MIGVFAEFIAIKDDSLASKPGTLIMEMLLPYS
jgi:hypothetical protein